MQSMRPTGQHLVAYQNSGAQVAKPMIQMPIEGSYPNKEVFPRSKVQLHQFFVWY